MLGGPTLTLPGASNYLVRVTHQNATYFIAAPQSGPGDIVVYDSATKVDQIGITGDVIEFEAENGKLFVNERYYVHNASSPPRTQYDGRGFEFALPEGAVLDSAEASRPSSKMPTNVVPVAAKPKGHFTINMPIQPSQGEKDTVFDLRYHLPYDSGKYVFKAWESISTDALIVVLPKSMSLTSGPGSNFQQVPEDPAVLTYATKNAAAGKPVEFTISGTGSMPREDQGGQSQQAGQQQANEQSADGSSMPSTPGGGIGAPIGTPDPLTKYKWWILSALALLLVAGAAFLVRKPAGAGAAGVPSALMPTVPVNRREALLDVLKEELFALESEKLSGTLSEGEYAETKAALETVLKRALKRS